VGGYYDNAGTGAAWVYARNNGVWTQQGKLADKGAIGAYQGWSVGLSAHGDTAVVGGLNDNAMTGAAWVYTRSNGMWAQQAKLVDNGAAGANQGSSVALSAHGNTAIVGGPNGVGAAWVYTRRNGVWDRQGSKLKFSVTAGAANVGRSVALSADGNTAIVGGPNDNLMTGAVWVFVQPPGALPRD
jgi:hypothetical protein